ncbi:MAG TPA: hypothetical protein PLQ56_19060 [Aggregatilineales bacterium]|nr:hypothetical protein [Aggregatilineales bacterium]
METDKLRIVLRARDNDLETFLANSRGYELSEHLAQLSSRRIEDWQIQVVGPETSTEAVLKRDTELEAIVTTKGCLESTPLYDEPDGSQRIFFTSSHGYALFENMNAAASGDNAQAVFLVAPNPVGSNQEFSGSRFLNNVRTVTPNPNVIYLLQAGFELREGIGRVIWTTSTRSLQNQYFDNNIIQFQPGHHYWFTITRTPPAPQAGNWWMCAKDVFVGSSTYTCVMEQNALGTELRRDINTSVWVENQNTNSLGGNWTIGFAPIWYAYGAKIYFNGFGQDWTVQHRHTAHSCSSSYPSSQAMAGSLLNGGQAEFIIANVPLRCPTGIGGTP